MLFFHSKDPKSELESLDRAIEILNDRYEKKLITIDQYREKSLEFGRRREKYLKMVAKQEKKEH